MPAEDLLRISYDMLQAFKPGDQDHEIFLTEFLSMNNITDPSLVRHLSAIFSGCVKFDRVIKVVVDAFYAKEGHIVLLSERNIYTALTYITVFHLDMIGISAYKRIVRSKHIVRMHKFLSLLCNEINLTSWIRESWKKLYDVTFVENTLLEPILRWLPDLNDFIDSMKRIIDNDLNRTEEDAEEERESQRVNTTEIKPFNLTAPKPRSVPVPELIPQTIKARQIPDSNYQVPAEYEVLEETKMENRRKAMATLEEANALEFSCAAASRSKSEKTKRRMAQIIQDEEEKHTYRPPRMNSTPKSALRSNATIKLNATAILREKKLCEDVEREQLKVIEELENGAFSDLDYKKWKMTVDSEFKEAKQAEAEKRLIGAKLARDMASLAHAENTVAKRNMGDEMRQESERLMKKFLAEKSSEEQEMRRLVNSMVADRSKIGEAQGRLKVLKQKMVKQVANESRQLLAKALEEAEKEMKKRAELIASIRAIESVPLMRQKLFDRTEVAGHGLMDEMSVAELEERLALLKMERERERSRKQDAIVMEKRDKQQKLTEAMDQIARHRMARSRVAAAAKLKEEANLEDLPLLTTIPNAADAKRASEIMASKSRSAVKNGAAERKLEIQERKKQLEEKISQSAAPNRNRALLKQKQTFRKALSENRFEEHQRVQGKIDQAISDGRRFDWDSLRLLRS